MEERRSKVEATVHIFMELWPLWVAIGIFILGYIRNQYTVADLKAQMDYNKIERDKQIAERDARVAEYQKARQIDHDALTKYQAIVDCMRHHDCG